MSRQITRIEYNWYEGHFDDYEVGKEYWLNDTDNATCTAITQLDGSFMVYFDNGCQVVVKNENKVFYKEI